MIKDIDNDLKEALEETLPMVEDVFNALLKNSKDDEVEKIQSLVKAFNDLGIQYNISFKVSAIKKTIDDLDMMLKDLLEIES